MRTRLFFALAALSLAALMLLPQADLSVSGGIAAAQSSREPDPWESQERAMELSREALEKLLQALELLMLTIPRYAPPEILENGDIIIRRLPLPGPGPKPGPEEKDEIDT